MALSAAAERRERDGSDRVLPVAAATTIHQGGLTCINSDGNAVPGSVSATLKAVGVAKESVVNAGAAGAKVVAVKRGTFLFKNYASDLVTKVEVGSDCFIYDDETVAKTHATNTRSVAGKVFAVEDSGVWVTI